MANSIRFDVRDNVRESLKRFEAASTRQIQVAKREALNRTAVTVRAESARRLQKSYVGLKIATLKKQIRFRRATRLNAEAVVTFSGSRFRLFGNFRVRTRRTPFGTGLAPGARLPAVLVNGPNNVLGDGDRARIFLARSRNGGRANFWVRRGAQRMPIDVVLVPGVGAAFTREGLAAQLGPLAARRFNQVFQQQLKFFAG